MDHSLIEKARAALAARIARTEETLRERAFMAALDEVKYLRYGVATRSQHRDAIAKLDSDLAIDRHVLEALAGVERVVDIDNGSDERAARRTYVGGRP